MFFYNKSNILTILFIVKYEKITLFDEFLVLLGPIISRFFACSNEEKNKQKQHSSLISMPNLYSLPTAAKFEPEILTSLIDFLFARAGERTRDTFVCLFNVTHFTTELQWLPRITGKSISMEPSQKGKSQYS